MAHIADCLIHERASFGLNNMIARELSPSPHSQNENVRHYTARKGEYRLIEPNPTPASTPRPNEKEKHVWRLLQPSESRRYQLFPAKDKLSISAGRKSPDPEQALALALEGQPERPVSRQKSRENLRRRKVSVPELGTMTTVQEVTMDSPTIPGRPPLHERSISAPGSHWRSHMFGEAILACIDGPSLDERAEFTTPETPWPESSKSSTKTPDLSQVRIPLSPKSLAPLVIPETTAPPPQRMVVKQLSANKLRNMAEGAPDVPPKSARMLDGRASPHQRNLSSANNSNNATPSSAPEGRNSPKPWCNSNSNSPKRDRQASDATGSRSQRLGHRRGESDTSVMDRGRPKRRTDGNTIKAQTSKRDVSAEQKAFATLPSGVRAIEATHKYEAHDLESLRKQAIGQAAKFEVLGMKDVESLSRELRALDERCDYLRKTHKSLRSGRRNLHERICTYLRSPRVARFSHDALLKQEEALAELDCSIDDWVNKLEQAENRRTRVRQKLLEHVAAALTLSSPDVGGIPRNQDLDNPNASGNANAGHAGTHTPPRSPTKSHSPQRLAETVPAPTPDLEEEHNPRRDVESIRIYADSDVYALLADVEEEINRMGEGVDRTPISAALDSAVCLIEPALNIFKEKEVERDGADEVMKASIEDIQKAVEEQEFTLSSLCFQPPERTITM